MKILILYAVTAIIFFTVDAIGLRVLIKPVFERHIEHLFVDPFRGLPAALFYMGYVAGLLWFVSVPAYRSGDPMAALVGGVLLGLMAYGTYEFTNYATLRDWSMEQVVVDTLWGGVLTGLSAWAGVMLVRVL
ncbi:DUF2177 family protein [Celeribacter halophilus]|uniref:Uncharacterized membrane protein n=1 Tax=Celeribacter halophilus TaxID=576117 RepID=A0A1I3QQ57_9RHOB|nr:DUF2177 family protein [Celeribacter halophilus]PZX13340.1 putative membrane protein [Celeribacter halophilus]SFJ36264.1 Uncharacterized membrane protein [Celeribacter halophilus]